MRVRLQRGRQPYCSARTYTHTRTVYLKKLNRWMRGRNPAEIAQTPLSRTHNCTTGLLQSGESPRRVATELQANRQHVRRKRRKSSFLSCSAEPFITERLWKGRCDLPAPALISKALSVRLRCRPVATLRGVFGFKALKLWDVQPHLHQHFMSYIPFFF